MIKKALLALVVLAFAGTTAVSAGNVGTSVSKDKRTTFVARGSSKFTTPPAHEKGLKAIFSNVGTLYPKGLYFCCYGDTISGPSSPIGETIWLAAGFTPANDATVTEIDVGVGWVEGTNAIVIGLYADDGGVPGKLLHSFKASGLGTFGDCCDLAVGKDKKGVAVTAGTPYWVGVTTNSKDADIWAAWNFNSTDQIDSVPLAGSDGTTWTSFGGSVPGPSFGVYGK